MEDVLSSAKPGGRAVGRDRARAEGAEPAGHEGDAAASGVEDPGRRARGQDGELTLEPHAAAAALAVLTSAYGGALLVVCRTLRAGVSPLWAVLLLGSIVGLAVVLTPGRRAASGAALWAGALLLAALTDGRAQPPELALVAVLTMAGAERFAAGMFLIPERSLDRARQRNGQLRGAGRVRRRRRIAALAERSRRTAARPRDGQRPPFGSG